MSRRDPFKSAHQHQEFARAYVAGAPLTRALVLAGYSPKQAKKGMVIVNRSKGLRQAIAECGKLLADLGGNITVQQQENLVRGRLVLNTIRGTDRGTPSAKALGSEKRVSMWRVENQAGLVVLHVPVTAEKLLAEADGSQAPTSLEQDSSGSRQAARHAVGDVDTSPVEEQTFVVRTEPFGSDAT